MLDYSIALSGLDVARRAIDVIGMNIANASTPGYHRQEVKVSSMDFARFGEGAIGGAEVSEVRRKLDGLLEREITRQRSEMNHNAQELDTLELVESAFGNVENEGLGGAISGFFNALTEATADPTRQGLREQVVWAADALAAQFRRLGGFLDNVLTEVRNQAGASVATVNDLSAEIARLNREIAETRTRGGTANLLTDRRDQAVNELADLIDVDVTRMGDVGGTVTVSAWGRPLVAGTRAMTIEAGLDAEQRLGISAENAFNFRSDGAGGRVGGLLSLHNGVVGGFLDRLDAMAAGVRDAVNRIHVQGVGEDGSFASLTGVALGDGLLADEAPGVTAGTILVRMIDETTGLAERHEVAVDPAADTLADVAARFDAIDGLGANVVDGALHIEADPGFRFDFLPTLLATPDASTLTGSAVVSVSGVYAGATNRSYECTVVGDGEVGVADDLRIEVRNEAGELVRTLDVGQGYAAGDALELDAGVEIALSAGTLLHGEGFTIDAVADTDTSGLLAAGGVNALFVGASALDLSVRQEILDDPRRFAGALSLPPTDGQNLLRMTELEAAGLDALEGQTVADACRRLTTDVGQQIAMRRARRDSFEGVMQQLRRQREQVSGVDVNDEAAKLMMFERMFQASSRVLTTQSNVLRFLMETV